MKQKIIPYLITFVTCLMGSVLVYSSTQQMTSEQASTEEDNNYEYVQPPLDSITQAFIREFTKNVCQDNRQAVAQMISYPFSQPYPLKSINNEKELLEHYDRVFSEELREKLESSTINDWSQMGWRGVMFGDGDIWLDRYSVDTVLLRGITMYGSEMDKAIELLKDSEREILGLPSHYNPNDAYLTTDSTTLIKFAYDLIDQQLYAFIFYNPSKIDRDLHKNSSLQLKCSHSVEGSCANDFYNAVLGNDSIDIWDMSCSGYGSEFASFTYGFEIKADTTSQEKNLLDTIGSRYNADVNMYGFFEMQPVYLLDVVK
jgi:hypothetical protein